MDEVRGFVFEEAGEGIGVGEEFLGEGGMLREEEEDVGILVDKVGKEGIILGNILEDEILEGFGEKDGLVIDVLVIIGFQ